MPGARFMTLCADDLSVELAPDLGGSLASFRRTHGQRVIDLMRPMSAQARDTRDVTGAAMFPMVPYTNRIAGNQFEFEGRTHAFEPNYPGQPLNLHGTGWQSHWNVTRKTVSQPNWCWSS
jgi:aldose 1-epimerase